MNTEYLKKYKKEMDRLKNNIAYQRGSGSVQRRMEKEANKLLLKHREINKEQ